MSNTEVENTEDDRQSLGRTQKPHEHKSASISFGQLSNNDNADNSSESKECQSDGDQFEGIRKRTSKLASPSEPENMFLDVDEAMEVIGESDVRDCPSFADVPPPSIPNRLSSSRPGSFNDRLAHLSKNFPQVRESGGGLENKFHSLVQSGADLIRRHTPMSSSNSLSSIVSGAAGGPSSGGHASKGSKEGRSGLRNSPSSSPNRVVGAKTSETTSGLQSIPVSFVASSSSAHRTLGNSSSLTGNVSADSEELPDLTQSESVSIMFARKDQTSTYQSVSADENISSSVSTQSVKDAKELFNVLPTVGASSSDDHLSQKVEMTQSISSPEIVPTDPVKPCLSASGTAKRTVNVDEKFASSATTSDKRLVLSPGNDAVSPIKFAQDPGKDPSAPGSMDSKVIPVHYYDTIFSFLYSNIVYVIGGCLICLTFSGILPGFFMGLLWGVFLSGLVSVALFWFLIPSSDATHSSSSSFFGNLGESLSKDLVLTPEELAEQAETFQSVIYKGWMNQLEGEYDPHTYTVGNSHSILVRLDKDVLRLNKPKQNLLRHTCWNEYKTDPGFRSQRMYKLAGVKVCLRPHNLARRRWWSRKYPIAIYLKPENHMVVEEAAEAADYSSESDVEESSTPSPKSAPRSRRRKGATSDDSGSSETPVNVVYLFARSGREKEHWFHRLRYAASYYAYEDYMRNSSPTIRTDLPSSDSGSPHHSSLSSLDSTARTPEDLLLATLRKRGASNASGSSYNSDPEIDAKVCEDDATEAVRKRRWSQPEAPETEAFVDVPDFVSEWLSYASQDRQFKKYIKEFLLTSSKTDPPESGISTCDLSFMTWRKHAQSKVDVDYKTARIYIEWANAFAARIFYDFLRDDEWIDKIKTRIQRKLDSVRLPSFIEALNLSKLDPGFLVPKATNVYSPLMNEWGLWVDMKLEYTGGIKLVLETKINLMKLKSEAAHGNTMASTKSATYSDEEVPESPESSADEDAAVQTPFTSKSESAPKQNASKKIVEFVDKIAQSKYFQEATDNKFVKKVMQGISDTPLTLMVEVKYLDGTLSLNIPPPPTDRLWYGFRARPLLTLRAYPKVGEKSLNIGHVTDWIEAKLKTLFEKNLIIPNMDDLVLPVRGGQRLLEGYTL